VHGDADLSDRGADELFAFTEAMWRAAIRDQLNMHTQGRSPDEVVRPTHEVSYSSSPSRTGNFVDEHAHFCSEKASTERR